MFVNILGLPISTQMTKQDVVSKCRKSLLAGDSENFTFINPLSYSLARKRPGYLQALQEFDGIMADGIGVVSAGRMLGFPFKERISFDSTALAPVIFEFCAENNLNVFLVGGEEGVAEKAKTKIIETYPGLNIVGTHSGFFEDRQVVFEEINSSDVDVVIVGMGAPYQEEFLLVLKRFGWKGLGFTCGGYFDQLTGGFDYYPVWVDRMNLRFLYRLIKEPRRLWKRYFVEYQVFVGLFLKAYLIGFVKTSHTREKVHINRPDRLQVSKRARTGNRSEIPAQSLDDGLQKV